MNDYYIVITDKHEGWDKIVGRRKTTLTDINRQAEWVWSLFNPKEKSRYRVVVQGGDPGSKRFDSDSTGY